ncbi:iron complex outermembrane receptor protein [Oxalobacteraceae bacterium GrIS 1.11]
MFKETILSRSLRLMFSSGVAVGLGLLAQPVLAQDAAPEGAVQRVEITGSAIKRIAKEGALPVQVLTQEDIKKTGAASASDLIQMLPAMQGFVPAASSVNGGGGGATTASLHALPSKYTLVLLDGQRMAPTAVGASQGGGFAVNLESIPLDAVERVEILTDGASALYGSDAIAGVVNFILKKNKTDATVFANIQSPQHPGGKSWSAGISKGFGDLDTDKFNILLSYSHDEQKEMAASQRPVSSRGAYLPFSYGGKNYIFDQRTGNTEPANITVNAYKANDPTKTVSGYSFNPYYSANGNCGSPLSGAQLNGTNVSCRFNYAATVEDIPKSVRDSGLLKGTLKINDDTSVWGELVMSRFDMTAQFAPSAQPFGLNATTRFPTLFNTYVTPYLAANGLVASSATMGYRSVLVGGRADEYITDARHFSTGINGLVMGWNYNGSLTLSHSVNKDKAAGGYTDFDKLTALGAAGTYDPVMGVGAASLGGALLNGTQFSESTSDLNTLHLGAQHDVFELPGGTSIISLGGDYSKTQYQIGYNSLLLANSGFSTQPASTDVPIGGNSGAIPFDASRNNWGLFSEMLFPITKTLEATLSARYDSYGKTHSKYVFDTIPDANGVQQQIADADLGNSSSAGTYKASFRWTPMEKLLVRGAYGTGFKAPNITDIAGAVTFGGSTSGSYSCPFPGTAGCLPGNAQYDLLAGPNGKNGADGLKPEKSKQWTLGFRVDPLAGLSLGFDLWNVQIKNQVLSSGVAEQIAFANPAQYKALFINPYMDPVGGFATIGYQQLPINGGVANYQGIDWDFSYRTKTPIGNIAAIWNGTYMMKQDYTNVPGGPVLTDLGVFGPDQAVVFRVQSHLSTTLQSGAFSNTLVFNFKSGYKDQAYPVGTSIFLAKPDGTAGASTAFEGLDVPTYITFDWQGKYDLNKSMSLTAGIKNLFDRKPPLSLQNGGGGNQLGYDGRYADPLGRAFYLTGNYKF